MAFKFKLQDALHRNVIRIVSDEVSAAIGQLRHRSVKGRDQAIHEARKSLKKLRGTLKLIRPEIGAAIYRKENKSLRDAGRLLSHLRDAGAIIDTFDRLAHKYRSEFAPNRLRPVRAALVAAKRTREKDAQATHEMTASARLVAPMAQNVEDWPVANHGFSTLAPGFQSCYRKGRRAMKRALRTNSADDYHEWRKRAKDHWYHLRLLENIWSDAMQAREKSVRELESSLGEDHNLSVLCDQTKSAPHVYGGSEVISLLVHLAEREQKKLRTTAQALGSLLYEDKPGKFVESVAKLWTAGETEAKPPKKRQPATSEPAKQPQRTASESSRKRVA